MTLKPGPNFKMTKQNKRYLSLIVDPHERGAQRRLMIQAQLAGEIRPAREKRRNDISEPTGSAE
jgi:hypothetical protein